MKFDIYLNFIILFGVYDIYCIELKCGLDIILLKLIKNILSVKKIGIHRNYIKYVYI